MLLNKIIKTNYAEYVVKIDTCKDLCSISYNTINVPFYVVTGLNYNKSYKDIITEIIKNIEENKEANENLNEFNTWDGVIKSR